MKRVLSLVLLAFVMCQCNFQSSQDQQAEKSLRDQYPEKFTNEYVSDRASALAAQLCQCDPYTVNSLNNVCTKEYGDLLKHVLALPEGIDGDGPSAGLWIEFAGELCSMTAITDVKVTDDQAKLVVTSEAYDKDEMSLAFVGDDWVIDDFGNCSKQFMKDLIQESREKYQSMDWDELINVLVERGYTKEDAAEASQGLKQEVDAYFANYPN